MQCRHIIAIGLPLALIGATPAPAQEAPSTRPLARAFRVVIVAEDVLDDLAQLAARAKRETVRCLIGIVQGDTAYIEIAWKPRIHKSSPSSVNYGGCPLATIAKWHNHLARFAPTPAEACYLSDTDVADALVEGAPPLQMVQVNESVMCWWTRAQVSVARTGAFLRPVGQQLTAVPVAIAAGATSQ